MGQLHRVDLHFQGFPKVLPGEQHSVCFQALFPASVHSTSVASRSRVACRARGTVSRDHILQYEGLAHTFRSVEYFHLALYENLNEVQLHLDLAPTYLPAQPAQVGPAG
jgi:hypothetical protein